MKCNSNFCLSFLVNSQHPWLLGSCRDEIIPPWHGMNQPTEAGKTTPAKRQPFLLLKAAQLHLKTNMEPKKLMFGRWCSFSKRNLFSGSMFTFGGEYCKPVEIYTICTHIYIYICICICIYIYECPVYQRKRLGIPPLGFFAPEISGCWKSPNRRGLELVGGSGCWSLVAWEFLLRSRLGGDFGAEPTKKNHQHIFLGQILSEFGGYNGGFHHFMWKNMNLKIARYIFGAPFKSGRVEMFMIYILWGTPWTSHEQSMKSSKLQGKSSSVRWGKTSHPIGSMGLVYFVYLPTFFWQMYR